MSTTTVFEWITPGQGGVGWDVDMDALLANIDLRLANAIAFDQEAGEDIDQYEVAYYKFSDGKLWLADGDDETKLGILAIADETKLAAATLRATTHGRVTNASWTWTAGDELYVDPSTPGALMATRPSSESSVVAMALSSTEIFFAPLAWKREKVLIPIGPLSASVNKFAFVKDITTQIAKAEILSGTTTVGSGAGTKWGFVLQNLTAADTVATKDTNGAEITADTPWTLGSITNGKIDPADVLELQVTKTGAPTALANDVVLLIEYDRFIG